MKKERGWWVVVTVGFTAIAISLLAAWNSARSLLAELPEAERQTIFQSNWRNFATTCLAASPTARPVLDGFCRGLAQVLQRLPECGSDCQSRTSSFTAAEPSR